METCSLPTENCYRISDITIEKQNLMLHAGKDPVEYEDIEIIDVNRDKATQDKEIHKDIPDEKES